MADHLKPTLTSTYSNFVTEMDARFDDLAVGLDPAVTTVTNPPTNTIRWSSAANKWQKFNGTAWNDLAATFAISISGNAGTVTNGVVTTGSYANPVWITSLAGSKITGDITGNAGTATKLATARNINGVAFDGSAAISINTNNAVTFNNAGTGAASGTTFDGSSARTISYNTIGAPSTTGANASGSWAISVTGTAANVTGTVALANGGTGSTTASGARTNLGLGTAATSNVSSNGGAGLASIGSDGVIEISRYIDFHAVGGDAVDYTVRLDGGGAGSTTLTLTGSFYSTGNITAAGNVTANSDERLKTDWSNLPSDFIQKLANVKSGTYTRIDTGIRQAGSSAQDWQKILPEVVNESDNDEKTLSLAYGNAALVSVVELAKEVLVLREEINKLKKLMEK